MAIERNQHHCRITGIRPKRLCCPRGGIQRRQQQQHQNCHHTDGCIDYTKSTTSNNNSQNTGHGHCSDQSTRCKPASHAAAICCNATAICCIHHPAQHHIPGKDTITTYCAIYHPQLCGFPPQREWQGLTWRVRTWWTFKLCNHRRAQRTHTIFQLHRRSRQTASSWREWRHWWRHDPTCTANCNMQCSPHVFEHPQEVCQLERMFFVWV
jgi:hypothetical protein